MTTSKTTSQYPLSNTLSYNRTSPSYYSYLAKFSTLVKPQSFKYAIKDERCIEAMKQEVNALEDNHTWKIVDLPKGKNVVGSK